MKQWNIKKIQDQLYWDTLMYGTCFVAAQRRKWWNPMRLLFGSIKLTRVAPEEVYKEFPQARGR